MKILYLTEKTFSASGGIEKACRIASLAMHQYSIESQGEFAMYSRQDSKSSNTHPYLPPSAHRGFGASKISFIIKSVRQGIKSDVVVLSNVSLLLPGFLFKLFAPKKKLILFTRGIEDWESFSLFKQKMLHRADTIIISGNFTKQKMKELFGLPEEKFSVLDNCLDPFLPELPASSTRNEFRYTYGFDESDIVLMTLSRLSIKEKDNGYEKIMFAIKKLHYSHPHLKYLFVGKYSDEEKLRLDKMVHALGIEYDVTFTGFIPGAVIGDYYNMADVFIVPGAKEGFGISFIEALYYNKPVIAGGSDGIAGHPENNSLGIRIDLQNPEDITAAIQKVTADLAAFMPDRKLVMEKFSYPVYKNNLGKLLETGN